MNKPWIKDVFGSELFGIVVLILVFMSVIGLASAVYLGFVPKDNSDSETGRSGMNIHTDALSGCQYLSRASTLTPRMGADGKQICEVKK